MKRLHLLLYMTLVCLGLQAQEEEKGEQLLVFRNTGVVDLLYTQEVDSILTTDSTQVFYAKDTTLIVPFAELDSVAVGSRNEMKFHKGVRELTAQDDLPWIIRFDGQSVYYRLTTPTNILPSVGMKLFCKIEDHLNEGTIFPLGLSVRVTNVTKLSEEIRVDVEVVPLKEIFERLFFAGSFSGSQPVAASIKQNVRRAPVHATLELGHTINMEDLGSIDISGNLSINGDAVISLNPFHNHSHADLILKYGFGTNVSLEARENASFNYEELGRDLRLGTFYGLLNLDAAVGAFADLSAELKLGVSIERTYSRRLRWDRNGDENSFELKEVNAGEPFEDEAKIDLTLKGEVFFGPILRIDFSTVGDLAGARAKVKVGPKVTGEISMGMLQQMRNYQPSFYGNAKLSLSSQIAVEGYVINRHNLVWGDVDEHEIFHTSLSFGEHDWNLFPDYTQSNAIATTTKAKEVKTDVATAVEEPTPTDLETGFELLDPEGNAVDSVFVGTIQSKPEVLSKPQTFNTERTLSSSIKQEELEGYTMRPIFHYAGYTISAAPVGIKKDVLLQPYSSTQSNGAMTFISSGPFLGSAVKDSTLYQVGAYLPVPLKQNVYQTGLGFMPIPSAIPINEDQSEMLMGTWKGTIDEQEITIIFNEDGTGKYNDLPFVYELNVPQSGTLLLVFKNEESMVYRVVAINETKIQLKDKRDKQQQMIELEKI